ncbi:MAG TPA: PilZ domain-containing protein [Blastocatellia bacterium]|nr:PilZ domain-containing protein [Blastocatellia bacterium]
MEEYFPVRETLAGKEAVHGLSVEQLNTYYWELEQLLDRIERAQTHYQVFNLSRSATVEEVCRAHRQILLTLRPACESSEPASSEELRKRIKQAIDRLCVAASVLSNFGKRVEYDNSLARRPSGPLPIHIADFARAEQSVTTSREALPQAATTSTNKQAVKERRRAPRLQLALPAHVTGHDRYHGKWQETTQTLNVSRSGVAIPLSRRIPQGTVLRLTLPLPARWRTHDHSSHNYNVYAIVRRVERPQQGRQVVGLEFLGEQPPAGYWEKPWGVFHTKE